MAESLSNIAMVCEAHAAKPDPKFLKWKLEDFVGGFVKVGFVGLAPDGFERREHMWVEVEEISRAQVKRHNCLKGRLDNDPLFEMPFARGDTVFVHREEIEDFLPPNPRRVQ